MIAIAGDGIKQFFVGVLAQVGKRWEISWHKTDDIQTDRPAAWSC